jgi:hypothetical protein
MSSAALGAQELRVEPQAVRTQPLPGQLETGEHDRRVVRQELRQPATVCCPQA